MVAMEFHTPINPHIAPPHTIIPITDINPTIIATRTVIVHIGHIITIINIVVIPVIPFNTVVVGPAITAAIHSTPIPTVAFAFLPPLR